jgi:translocator protein
MPQCFEQTTISVQYSRTQALHMKPNYIIIPLIAIIVAYVASMYTTQGVLLDWYISLEKPGWYPPKQAFGLAWGIIYPLITASALIFYNKTEKSLKFTELSLLFALNAFLNASWSYVFFSQQNLEGALISILFLNITTITLILILWPQDTERRYLYFFHTLDKEQNENWLKLASMLLIPYFLWGLFAMFLNYSIWQLNV